MTQATLRAAAATYRPAYGAPSARLERTYQRYIKARVRRDAALVNLHRATLNATIDAAVRGA